MDIENDINAGWLRRNWLILASIIAIATTSGINIFRLDILEKDVSTLKSNQAEVIAIKVDVAWIRSTVEDLKSSIKATIQEIKNREY